MSRRTGESYFECVYIIKLLPTGHFYIGASGNFENRKKTHYEGVRDLIKIMRSKSKENFDRFRKETILYKTSLHYDIAEIMNPLLERDWSNVVMRRLKSAMVFEILHRCSDCEEARLKEGQELGKYANDPLCLNKKFKSGFRGKQTPIKYKNKKQ